MVILRDKPEIHKIKRASNSHLFWRLYFRETTRMSGSQQDSARLISGSIFRVVEPIGAFSPSASPTEEILLSPGTLLNYRGPGGYADPCSGVYLFWDEFLVIGGENNGRLIAVNDAATLYDSNGSPTHLGWRPRIGLPGALVLQSQPA